MLLSASWEFSDWCVRLDAGVEVLGSDDGGPLRRTVKRIFNPLIVNDPNIVVVLAERHGYLAT
ncbi:MAG: hypothetical protein QOH91_3311 [Mycobacterium sp.]|jgi:hypothetical protein|nr:hypothetical protein [Mycobacterium sp.]